MTEFLILLSLSEHVAEGVVAVDFCSERLGNCLDKSETKAGKEQNSKQKLIFTKKEQQLRKTKHLKCFSDPIL